MTLTGYSAMAGAIGGGGLGDLGIRYGYQRFLPDVMLAVVLVLIVFVQIVQSLGDWAGAGSATSRACFLFFLHSHPTRSPLMKKRTLLQTPWRSVKKMPPASMV